MKRNGLTIIELLVVITLIGVLSAAVTVFLNPVKRQKQARDARRKQDITVIASALQSYNTLVGKYPRENDCDTSILETNTHAPPGDHCVGYGGVLTYDWEVGDDDTIHKALVTDKDLVKKLPVDPINKEEYFYRYEPASPGVGNGVCKSNSKGCTTYWIGTLLENPEDPAKAIFRCSDNKDLGVGCKEVTGTSLLTTDPVP